MEGEVRQRREGRHWLEHPSRVTGTVDRHSPIPGLHTGTEGEASGRHGSP